MVLEYDTCADLFDGNGLAVVKSTKTGKLGMVNTQGKIVISPTFEQLQFFSSGLAAAAAQDKYGFIDKTGKFVIQS